MQHALWLVLAMIVGLPGCADSSCPEAADYAALEAYSGPQTCQQLTHATAHGTFNVVPTCTVDGGSCVKGADLRYWQRDLGVPHTWEPRFWADSATDSDKLNAASWYSRTDTGSTIFLDRVYTQTKTWTIYKWHTYRGGGIKRACSPRATLTADVAASAVCLPVNSTTGLTTVGTPILVVPDATYHPSRWTLFVGAGSTPTSLCLSGPVGNATSAGAYAIVAFPMLTQVEDNGTAGPTPGMVLEDMEIDGSASCNDGTHDWRFNDVGAVKAAIVRRVWLHDTPSESFTICGSTITDNRAERLGGSFVHKSCSAAWHDTIAFNRVRGVNLFTDGVMGHSEGAITLSANGGNMRVYGNAFADGLEGALGSLNGDDNGIVAEGNVFNTFARRYEFASGSNSIDVDRNAWIGVP